MGETVEIHDWHDLDAVRDGLGADYILMNDLTPETEGYDDHASENANKGEGWEPIGDGDEFTGTFDGQGYEIEGLYIDRPEEDEVGLFGRKDEGSEISNIGMIDVDVSGGDRVGVLVGMNIGTVSNSYATGEVSGESDVGGLVGTNRDTVSNSYATGDVSGVELVGGLVGENYVGTVSNSYATGDVSGVELVGGLIGQNNLGTVSDSFALHDPETPLIGFSDGTLEGRVTDAPEEDMQDIRLYTEDGFKDYDDLDKAWDIETIENWGGETWHIDDGEDYPQLGEPTEPPEPPKILKTQWRDWALNFIDHWGL